MGDEAAAAAVVAPVRRRRLRHKQHRPEIYGSEPEQVVPAAAGNERVVQLSEDQPLEQYMQSPEALRLKGIWARMNNQLKKTNKSKVSMRKLRQWRSACESYKAQVDDREWDLSGDVNDVNEGALFGRRWLASQCKNIALCEKERAAAMTLLSQIVAQAGNVAVDDSADISGGFPVLLTYNGDWGLLDISGIAGICRMSSVDDVAGVVADMPAVRSLEGQAQALCERLTADRAIDAWAWSLEVCPKSVKDAFEQTVPRIRFHVHLYLKPTGLTLCKNMLDINGSSPHIAKTILSRMGAGRSRSGNACWVACFYTSVKKIGSISRRSSVEMFVDYLVLEGWVWNLIQMRKLTYEEGRNLFTAMGRNCAIHLTSLDTAKRQRQMLAAMEEQRLDSLRLESAQMPFRRLDEVERWLHLFQVDASRYPFLILDGPSCMGKTRFVHSLVPRQCVFYSDCSNDQLPDLRRFDRDIHKLILLDEMGPTTAITLKKLLQSGLDVVTLGTSPTQQFTYTVYVRGAKIVLTSNNWERDLKSLPTNDQEWLSRNSHYVKVLEPLWIMGNDSRPSNETPSRRPEPSIAQVTPRLNDPELSADLSSWLPYIAEGSDNDDGGMS